MRDERRHDRWVLPKGMLDRRPHAQVQGEAQFLTSQRRRDRCVPRKKLGRPRDPRMGRHTKAQHSRRRLDRRTIPRQEAELPKAHDQRRLGRGVFLRRTGEMVQRESEPPGTRDQRRLDRRMPPWGTGATVPITQPVQEALSRIKAAATPVSDHGPSMTETGRRWEKDRPKEAMDGRRSGHGVRPVRSCGHRGRRGGVRLPSSTATTS